MSYENPRPYEAQNPFGVPAPTEFQPTQPVPTQPLPGQPVTGQPQATQPLPGQPAYGEPYGYQPTSAVPLSAPPVSGMPGYPPVSGVPQPGYGSPQPAGRGRTVPVLAVLSAVFLIAAIVLGGLFITKNSAYNKQAHTLKARNSTIDTQTKQLKNDSDQLKSLQSQLDDETQKATGSQNQVTELTHEKQVISQCLDLSGQAVDAAERGDTSTANKLAAQAQPICDEAEGYLD